jgi:hypothetical protein
VHPVLRSAIAVAKAKVSAGARTAFALLRLFALEMHASLVRTFVYCAALGAFALILAELAGSRGAVEAKAQADWIEVIRPLPAFAMSIPEFDEPRYSILRHVSGSGRKDVLSFGETDGATATVEIYRPGHAEPADEDITASISELRLSGPRLSPNTIETKFGAVAVESVIDGARSCLRFSRKFENPQFEIGGTFCNAGLELVDHGMIACALDRLSLLAAGSDPKLAARFARAELRRNFCGAKSVFVAATPKRSDWIEASRDPKLRGRTQY